MSQAPPTGWSQDGIPAIVQAVTSYADAVSKGRPLDILVLADPQGFTCDALRREDHRVTCCIARQRPAPGALASPHLAPLEADVLELSAPIAPERHWDVVIAYLGWDRFVATHSDTQIADLIAWVGRSAGLGLFAASRDPIDLTNNALGPWTLDPGLRSLPFVAEWPRGTTDSPPWAPLIAASTSVLLTDLGWLDAASLTVLPPGPANEGRLARTLLHAGSTIVKFEESSTDFFQRCQVNDEARFLSTVSSGTRRDLSLPRVIASYQGGVVSQLVRTAAPGSHGPQGDPQERVDALLDLAQRWAAHGLFHNDFRPWNLIWRDGTASLIDFSGCCDHDLDVSGLPQVLALAGTILAVLGRSIPSDAGFATAVRDLACDAGLPEGSDVRLLGTPWLRLAEIRPRVDTQTADDREVLRSVALPLLDATADARCT